MHSERDELRKKQQDQDNLLRSQRTRIDDLKDDRNTALTQLRAELARQQRVSNDALVSAETATKEVLELRLEMKGLRDERERMKKSLESEKKKDEELAQHKAYCEEYKRKASLSFDYHLLVRHTYTSCGSTFQESVHKKKLKGLGQENKDLKRELEAFRNQGVIEESLQIGDYSQYADYDFEEENQHLGIDLDSPERPQLASTTPLRPRVPLNLSHVSLIRDPLANRPPAQIRDDDDEMLDLHARPFASTWTLPPTNKKRKLESDDRGTKFPIKLDSKGRPIGNVMLGSRIRLQKS